MPPEESPQRFVVKRDPPGFVRDLRLAPHQLIEAITPQRDLFVLAHLGVPHVDVSSWRLEVGGLVERPHVFSFDAILRLPKRHVETFHQCAGFPRRPDIATRRVANVRWGGADLQEVLMAAGIMREAKFVISHGIDHGEYDGLPPTYYVKDMPLDRLARGGVLLAYEINGEPLGPAHGFPLRLVIPGYYGTNAVKWLHRVELAAERATGIFTTELYNDPVPRGARVGNAPSRPVWEAGPEAIIVAPKDRSIMPAGSTEIHGWAWASAGVARVDISPDAGESWFASTLEQRNQWSWQRFSAQWVPPAPGTYTVMARATDALGAAQPMQRARNAIHAVRIDVMALS